MLKVTKVEFSEITTSKTKSSIIIRIYPKLVEGNEIKTFVDKTLPETAKLYPDMNSNKPQRLKVQIWEEESMLKELIQAVKENNSTKFVMFLESQTASFKNFAEMCVRDYDFSEAIVS
jgi:hypothetical protein